MFSFRQLPETDLPQNRNETEIVTPRLRKTPNYKIVLGRLTQVFTLFKETFHAVANTI